MTPRGSRPAEARIAFDALSIEGGLLGADWLGRVAQRRAPAQEPADYRIPKGLDVRDEIARSWRIAQACFRELEAGRAAGGDPRALAQRFVEPLLRDAFGFASLAGCGAEHNRRSRVPGPVLRARRPSSRRRRAGGSGPGHPPAQAR